MPDNSKDSQSLLEAGAPGKTRGRPWAPGVEMTSIQSVCTITQVRIFLITHQFIRLQQHEQSTCNAEVLDAQDLRVARLLLRDAISISNARKPSETVWTFQHLFTKVGSEGSLTIHQFSDCDYACPRTCDHELAVLQEWLLHSQTRELISL